MKQFKILGSSQPTDSIQEGTIASAQAYGYDSGIKKQYLYLKSSYSLVPSSRAVNFRVYGRVFPGYTRECRDYYKRTIKLEYLG